MDIRINQPSTHLSSLPRANLTDSNFKIPSVHQNPSRDPSHFEKFIEALETNSQTQIVIKSTRKTSLLDSIFVRNVSTYTEYTGLEFPGSVHKAVSCQLIKRKCSCACNGTKVFMDSIRNIASTDCSYSYVLLPGLSWEEYFSSAGLDRFNYNKTTLDPSLSLYSHEVQL